MAPGAGTAHADENCPVTQLCGPVSQEYAGDQNGARYGEVLDAYGVKGTEAQSTKLGQTICAGRRKGFSGDQLIANFQSDLGVGYDVAVNTVGMAEYHFCPDYFDMS